MIAIIKNINEQYITIIVDLISRCNDKTSKNNEKNRLKNNILLHFSNLIS